MVESPRMRDWREVIDMDAPSFLPVTENTRRVTSAAAQHGTYYAALLAQELRREDKTMEKTRVFFSGLMDCMGIPQYNFSQHLEMVESESNFAEYGLSVTTSY